MADFDNTTWDVAKEADKLHQSLFGNYRVRFSLPGKVASLMQNPIQNISADDCFHL